MDEELKKLIEERCENQIVSQYILNSMEYFKTKNLLFYNGLCDSMKNILLKYKQLTFKMTDNTSFFSEDEYEVGINKKAIEMCRYTTFIHEITHVIHGLGHSFHIPLEYETVRKKIISNDNFINMVRSIMKNIIQIKKAIIELISQRSKKQADFSKKINFISEETKINNSIFINLNFNNIIKEISNVDLNFSEMFSMVELINKQFESLIDDIRYRENSTEEQLFHVLSSMEGIIDALLLGALCEGYSNECLYLKGIGHTKDYFEEDLEISYIELLADYSVLKAYNNTTLIEMIESTIGDEMCSMLNESLSSVLGNNNIDIKRK